MAPVGNRFANHVAVALATVLLAAASAARPYNVQDYPDPAHAAGECQQDELNRYMCDPGLLLDRGDDRLQRLLAGFNEEQIPVCGDEHAAMTLIVVRTVRTHLEIGGSIAEAYGDAAYSKQHVNHKCDCGSRIVAVMIESERKFYFHVTVGRAISAVVNNDMLRGDGHTDTFHDKWTHRDQSALYDIVAHVIDKASTVNDQDANAECGVGEEPFASAQYGPSARTTIVVLVVFAAIIVVAFVALVVLMAVHKGEPAGQTDDGTLINQMDDDKPGAYNQAYTIGPRIMITDGNIVKQEVNDRKNDADIGHKVDQPRQSSPGDNRSPGSVKKEIFNSDFPLKVTYSRD